jgi:hypothetical protein
MELTQNDIELLDRFFRNELTADELAIIQEKMKQPDFAEAAKAHFESLNIVQAAGRDEFRSLLTTIHTEIASKNGFEKYKASKKGGTGSGGGGFAFVIIGGLIAVTAYLYSTGRLDTESIQKIIPTKEKIDTVYHYKIQRDTIYTQKTETITKKVYRTITDTVFVKETKQLQPPQSQMPK